MEQLGKRFLLFMCAVTVNEFHRSLCMKSSAMILYGDLGVVCFATSITSGSCEAARDHLDRDMFLLLDMFQEIMRQKLVNFAAVCVPALEKTVIVCSISTCCFLHILVLISILFLYCRG